MQIRVPRRLISFILTGALSSTLACSQDKKKEYKTESNSDGSISDVTNNLVETEQNIIYIEDKPSIKDKSIEESISKKLELFHYVKASSNVNIRSEATSKSEKLGMLFKDQLLPLIKEENGWAEVQYDGKSAFISMDYLELFDSYEYQTNNSIPTINLNDDLLNALKEETMIEATANVNVRSEATTKSDKLDQLRKGDTLPFISYYNDEWYQVNYNGIIAYVYRQYAKVKSSYSINSDVSDIVFMISKNPLYDITTFEEIKSIPKNEIVEVFFQTDDYYLVRYNNTIGLVEKCHCQSLGDKYIIIDISSQNLKVYVDDKVIIDTPVVTGKDSTPTYCGIFEVYKKGENVNWPEFNVTVKYAMAFNRGEYIHDAKWRKKFGGDIYKKNGSHGCVNVDEIVMEEIYETTEIGTPVLVKK